MSPTFPEFTKYLQDESLTIESLYSQPNTRVLFKASDVSNVDFTNIEHLFLVGGNDPTSLNIRNRTKLKTLGFFDGGGLSSTMREDVLHLVKNAALSNLIVSRWGDTNLAANTFLDATGLVQIIMSDVVTTECSIFTRCRNLVKAVFPNATSMSNDVFNNCSNLKTIYFPRLRSMGAYAFQECKELEEVSFPALESIPGGFALGGNVSVATFGMCSKLTKGYFPVVQTIGEYAFGGCLRFANREFPRAESIASTAFAGCP
jgi:hypothetical protein